MVGQRFLLILIFFPILICPFSIHPADPMVGIPIGIRIIQCIPVIRTMIPIFSAHVEHGRKVFEQQSSLRTIESVKKQMDQSAADLAKHECNSLPLEITQSECEYPPIASPTLLINLPIKKNLFSFIYPKIKAVKPWHWYDDIPAVIKKYCVPREHDARIQKQHALQKTPSNADTSCHSASPGGKDPKDKNRDKKSDEKISHPNGLYKGIKYHHAQSGGQKSPAPHNGQLALNNSLEIANTTPRRIGIEKDYFVIFDQTRPATTSSPAEFHGHIRTWEELTDTMRAILRKENLVNAKGKILL